VEANLRDIATQNDAVLERLTILEAQVGFLSATVGAATQEVGIVQQSFAGTNTPHADTSQTQSPTPEPIPTVTLAENEFIIRVETAVYLVPDASEPLMARFGADISIIALGGFIDKDGDNWLVFKPTREMNLNLTPDTPESVIYDGRPYAFIQANSILRGIDSFSPAPIEMRLADIRLLRATPERVNNEISGILNVGTSLKVFGVYTHPTGSQERWIVIDLDETPYETLEHELAFILYTFTAPDTNTPKLAFGDIDMQIVDRMPEYPYTPPVAPAPTFTPAPTNVPLPSPTPCLNIDVNGNCT